MVIEIENLDKVLKKLEGIGNVDLKIPVQRGTQLVYRTARDLAPVSIGRGPQAPAHLKNRKQKKGERKGGHLKRSIKFKTEGGGIGKYVQGKVSTNVEYAIWQEYGTAKREMVAQPFLRPALRQHRNTIRKAIAGYVIANNRKFKK